MKILVNTNIINNTSIRSSESITSIDESIKRIENILNEMGNAWQGNDYNQFITKMNDFIADLKKISASVKSYNNFALGYSGAVNKLDEFYKGKEIVLK